MEDCWTWVRTYKVMWNPLRFNLLAACIVRYIMLVQDSQHRRCVSYSFSASLLISLHHLCPSSCPIGTVYLKKNQAHIRLAPSRSPKGVPAFTTSIQCSMAPCTAWSGPKYFATSSGWPNQPHDRPTVRWLLGHPGRS